MSGPTRVLVTGIGPVSAAGIGAQSFLDALETGARRPVTAAGGEEAGGLPAAAVAITGFRVEDYLDSQKTYLDRASQFAFAATRLALRDAGLDLAAEDRTRVGLMFGSAWGCLGTMDAFFRDYVEKGPRSVRPLLFPHAYQNTSVSLLAIEHGLRGPHACFASSGTASAEALLYARDAIRLGRADVVLAGGVEALTPLLCRACAAAGLLAPAGIGADGCFPFDARRGGAVLGEGGAILVLESEAHARARGARALAELAGGGSAAGPLGGVPALARAMAAAAADAGIGPSGPWSYISAAARGNIEADAAEAAAIASLFGSGPAAPPVTAIKGTVGETLGAAAALQAAASAGALARGRIPPAAGPGPHDPALPIRIIRAAVPSAGEAALVNAIDPGGAATALVFRRV